jgi:acetoin utilization deacetylase AcuC-like enzyme
MSIDIFHSKDFTCVGYGVDTREKSAWIAERLSATPIPGVRLVVPASATAEQIGQAHDPRYVRAFFNGHPMREADRNGMGPWSTDLRTSVLASIGGVIASARTSYTKKVNSGSLSSGLHHARFSFGAGFCTFNGLVIAATELLKLGARRVLILDLDAHCGGGTASLIEGMNGVEQVDIGVSSFDSYASTHNSVLTRSSGATYLPDVQNVLQLIADPTSIDVVLYNAGMDPHERCSTGGSEGITTRDLETREQLVFAWAASHGIPVSFALAGGYSGRRLSKDELVDLHLMTVTAALAGNYK